MQSPIQELVTRISKVEAHLIPRWIPEKGFVNTKIKLNPPAGTELLRKVDKLGLPSDYVELLALSNGITLFQWTSAIDMFAGQLVAGEVALEYFNSTSKLMGNLDSFPFFNMRDVGMVSFDLVHPGKLQFPYGGSLEITLLGFINLYLESQGTYQFPA